MPTRRKCFITYHHTDQSYVNLFVEHFDDRLDVFIARQLGQMKDDIVKSNDVDYVMRKIREDYLQDSTVTVVMAGKCTWARRYVDWELQASLRSGTTVTPNGLLGVKLPTFTYWPERLNANLLQPGQSDCYARWIEWSNTGSLRAAIEAAHQRRTTHMAYIVNKRERWSNNRQCE